MKKTDIKYSTYLNILEEELIPAMGCTEPIAIAYAAAKARDILGDIPERILLQISGSIIKNVKSVIVPNTGKMKGIPAAAIAGIVAGKSDLGLEVLSVVTEDDKMKIKDYLDKIRIDIEHIEDGPVFDIIITEFKGTSYSKVRISDHHTNIVLTEKDHQVIMKKDETKKADSKETKADRKQLTIEDIWDFANSVEIADVTALLDKQISYNMAIAEEGLRGDYGANIGKVLMSANGNDIKNRAKALAAAGSDARMNGCEMPVVINSGSGNQGITCSVPVIEYAKELNVTNEKLYRALVLSNLVAIHEKTGIGTLSAYCGAVSAGAGAGAGIAYLCGGDYQDIIHTIVNSLAIVSGIVCDGAKASCAAKIAASVDAAIFGYQMYKNGQEFKSGDGIVMHDVESTIDGIGCLGRDGMRETNEEIIRLMISN
ncbi:MAG: L-serine ammonia-lyase, iron-sulfur-dependent, subunit alpha [Lachnospiraceae bacterium]|nr:L-serine ammonia-lyase, iron-sulfur-dependent, subunit alpha [Lachnospiraceae bacterium]